MTEQEKDQEFQILLNKVALHALSVLGIASHDETYVAAMGDILIHLSDVNTDEYIADRAMHFFRRGQVSVPYSQVLQIITLARQKCDRHRYALELAMDEIEHGDVTGQQLFDDYSYMLNKAK